MKKTILWEKWVNPLGGGSEFIGEDQTDNFSDTTTENEIPKVRPVIPTVAGFVPVNIYHNLSENVHFQMMHVNFNISPMVMGNIKKTPGVEFLDVVTRYRARIGFGKCFDAEEVKAEIAQILGATTNVRHEENPLGIVLDGDLRGEVDSLMESLSINNYWILYVIPNREIAHKTAEQEGLYRDQLEIYREALDAVGGILYLSNI